MQCWIILKHVSVSKISVTQNKCLKKYLRESKKKYHHLIGIIYHMLLQIWGLLIRKFHVQNPCSGPESIKYYHHGFDSGPVSYIIIMVCL